MPIDFEKVTPSGWMALMLAPVLGLVACAGLWLTIMSARENVYMGRAVAQLMTAVSEARDMKTDARMTNDVATGWLYDRFQRVSSLAVRGTGSGRYMENPWGGTMKALYIPSKRQLWLENGISAVACRRILGLFHKNMGAIGVARAAARSGVGLTWRDIYVPETGSGAMTVESIRAGCGDQEPVVLGFLFDLR